MTGYTGKTTNKEREVTGSRTQAEREDAWGEIVGEIVSFDAEAQTATIKPLYKPRHKGEPVEMPELLEVPVRFPRAGGFFITHPVRAGDKVTMRPQMRNSEEYHESSDYTANDTRSFSLADYEAFLDGGESLQDPIGSFNANNFEVRGASGLPKIEMAESGTIKIMVDDSNYIEISSAGITLKGTAINLNP